MIEVAARACTHAGLAAVFTNISPLAVGAASCTYTLAINAACKIGAGTLSALRAEVENARSEEVKLRISVIAMTSVAAAVGMSAYAAIQVGQGVDSQLSASQMLALAGGAALCQQVFKKLKGAAG